MFEESHPASAGRDLPDGADLPGPADVAGAADRPDPTGAAGVDGDAVPWGEAWDDGQVRAFWSAVAAGELPVVAVARPVAGAGDDELVELAVAAQQAVNRAFGQLATVVAALARRRPEVVDRRRLVVTTVQQVAAELAPALGLGIGAAMQHTQLAVTLADRLPATLAEVCAGRLDWTKARILAEAVLPLTAAHAAEVERRVLPHAARRTAARHRAAVHRAVTAVDPAGAAARRRQRLRAVELIRLHHGDGMASLIATLPAEHAELVHHAADTWARRRKAAGDPRTLDQLRATALLTWATSFLAHGDATVCDTHCHPTPADSRATDPTPAGPAPADRGATDPTPAGPAPADRGATDAAPAETGRTQTQRSGRGGPLAAGRMEVDGSTAELRDAGMRAPLRHGRPAALRVLWDLRSLLGLDQQPGELLDSGVALDTAAMRELLAGGVRLRRMLIDPATGTLLDLTPTGWTHPDPPPRASSDPPGGPPARCPRRREHARVIELFIVCDQAAWHAWRTDDRTDPHYDPDLAAAITLAPTAVRALLTAPDTTDPPGDPTRYRPTARLAELLCLRYRHPANPAAPTTAAAAGDLDHTHPHHTGGPTSPDNLRPLTRLWHRLKTHTNWTITAHGHTTTWTSPTGRTYRIHPYDYRTGP